MCFLFRNVERLQDSLMNAEIQQYMKELHNRPRHFVEVSCCKVLLEGHSCVLLLLHAVWLC